VARLKRYAVPGQPQHLIQRGHNRQPIFFAEDDYGYFYDCLREAAARFRLRVHAWVFMSNHFHLLATPDAPDSISKTMQRLGTRYVPYVNRREGRTGTLWQGRYKACIIDSEAYLLACARYIDLNPVRAGLVREARDYLWSSHRGLAEGVVDPLLSPHPLYLALGPTAAARQEAYRALCRAAPVPGFVDALREATNSGWVLGGDAFKARIARDSGRRVAARKRGRPRGGPFDPR
jgi:putative transposase